MRDAACEFLAELEATNRRILQEVACAEDWNDVSDILHHHAKHYFALPPRVREQLNEAIKDLMEERTSR
jgi:hypothetical protein